MDAQQIEIAEACLAGSHDGSMGFPEIVGRLVDAGFEGYAVDYRASRQVYYLPGGGCVERALPQPACAVGTALDADRIEKLVRWAQADGPDYTYTAFSEKIAAAGCAGYLVSFSGRRVLYYGRTAEVHVEHFPS